MKVKETLKKVWKYGKRAYIAAYLAVSAHVGYDFLANNLPRIARGDMSVQLEVRRFKANVEGKEKRFTLAGEYHFYNKKENEIGKELVKEHSNFADECNDETVSNTSLKETVYGLSVALPMSIGWFYREILGQGRWYDSISDIAKGKGEYIHALEEPNNLKDFSLKNRLTFQWFALRGALIAPLYYYERKNEEPYNHQENLQKIGNLKENLVDRRDKDMAESLVKLLKSPKIGNLLATVGRAHLPGIISNLNERLTLTEITDEIYRNGIAKVEVSK